MEPLENPPENPCFGCGPANPRGLHLRFGTETAPDGRAEVVAEFTPAADEIGWPGLLHGGLHYFVLHEASYWAALVLGGKVHRFGGRAVFEQDRLPRVGRRAVVRAGLAGRTSGVLTVRAATTNDRGARCGVLESTWRPASRAEVDRAGLTLPQYLLDEMDP
jgi:hypothetical protein